MNQPSKPQLASTVYLACLALCAPRAAAQVVIHEVQSANHQTLVDADGNAYDWIELANFGPSAVDLSAWSLSDDAADQFQWTFGSELLPSGGHLLVYASGLDLGQGLLWNTIIDDGALWTYASASPAPPDDWEDPDYDDSAWPQGQSGFGHGYPNLRTPIAGDTLHVRQRFSLTAAQVANARRLILHLDYDDGFVAYLNGVEVARSKLGMRGVRPPTDELATDHNQGLLQWSQSPPRYRLDRALELLIPGENILAIEVHNQDAGGNDLCCTPILSLGHSMTWSNSVQANPLLDFDETGLHTNFRLSAAGETLFLMDAAGVVADQLTTGRLYLDQSVGRPATGESSTVHFREPTPGAANSTESRPGYASAPTIDPPGGRLRSRLPIQVTSLTPGAELRYTLDGSDPTQSSALYTGSLTLTPNSKGVIPLRTRAFSPGLWPSRITTASFLTTLPHSLPVFSLVTDPQNMWGANGLYSNTNAEHDRPVHVTLFETDGRPAFALDLGAKPHGHASLSYPQKPLALIARSGHGPDTIDYPVFGEDYGVTSFRRLLLRNAGQDFNRAMLRDGLCAEIMASDDLDVSGYRPVATYINGAYWGIQNLRERHDKHHPESHHGADADNLDLLEGGGWKEHEGDYWHFFSVCDYLNQHDLADPAVYARAREVIDIEEFMNYAISEDFFLNDDWPHNNVKFWCPRTIDGKWRWFQYDFDGSLDAWGTGPSTNRLGVVFGGSVQVTKLLADLHDSPHFRRDFVNRYADLLNSTLSVENTLGVLHRASARISTEVPRHLERWNQTNHNWRADINEIQDFLQRRPAFARQHLASHFGLGASYTLHLDVSPPQSGSIRLSAIETAGPFTGTYFQGNPVTLTARTSPGFSFSGWSDGVSAPNRTIDPANDLTLVAHFQHGPTGSGQAIIAEIQYHPSDSHDSGDWIELQNPGAAYLDISNYILTDSDTGHAFVLPAGTVLAPCSPLVIARDLVQFQALHPSIPAVGSFGFGLSNSSDSVRLYDASASLVDEVSYTDHTPWPAAADGSGRTLELRDAQSDNSNPAAWGPSLAPHGTPGASNSLSP